MILRPSKMLKAKHPCKKNHQNIKIEDNTLYLLSNQPYNIGKHQQSILSSKLNLNRANRELSSDYQSESQQTLELSRSRQGKDRSGSKNKNVKFKNFHQIMRRSIDVGEKAEDMNDQEYLVRRISSRVMKNRHKGDKK